jgi:hypothetical protein
MDMRTVAWEWRFMFLNKRTCSLALLAFAVLVAIAVEAADVPLTALQPVDIFNLDPGTNVSPVLTKVQFPTGGFHPALKLTYQSRITYNIPADEASFSAILYRVDALKPGTGDPERADINRIKVRFLLDNKLAYDTVLDVTMPPEQLVVPLGAAKKLTIAVDQMLAGGAIYLADANFSPQPVSRAMNSHILVPGSGYANLGSGVRQVAFRTYNPGETVPLQLEFSGSSTGGSVTITVSPNNGHTPMSFTVPVTLHAGSAGAIGSASWRVPSVLGPALLDLKADVDGKQVYRRTLNVAVARHVDLSKISPSSTFGVHISTSGIPYLTDDGAGIWGAKWARVALRWEVVEYNRGQYDWRRIDEVVDVYRAQSMEVMGVIGEIAPKWAGRPGPASYDEFNKFVEAAVQHFQTKISHWDVYNEVDSKYYGNIGFDKNDPNADVNVLRKEMQTIRQISPSARLICCSTGTSYWLRYDKRLYDNGLLNLMDIISVHPYQTGPPELKDGAFNYLDIIAALRNLEHAYGASKPVWSTEANWLIGPEGEKGVYAPDVDEHGQSKFLVRVNLLSMALGVPYFTHSAFFYPFHRELLLDSVASYANMTYNFGTATDARMLNLPEGVYGVLANTNAGTVCALWTTRESARASVTGMSGTRMQDLYGNPVSYNPSSIPLNGDPIYILGSGPPSIVVSQVPAAPTAWPLPNLWTWSKALTPKYERTASGVRVTTAPTNYGNLLKSPTISVQPNSCYRVTATIHTMQGGVGLLALDGTTGERITPAVGLFTVTGHDEFKPALKVKTGRSKEIQILLGADNPNAPEITEFEASNPEISPCYPEQVKR